MTSRASRPPLDERSTVPAAIVAKDRLIHFMAAPLQFENCRFGLAIAVREIRAFCIRNKSRWLSTDNIIKASWPKRQFPLLCRNRIVSRTSLGDNLPRSVRGAALLLIPRQRRAQRRRPLLHRWRNRRRRTRPERRRATKLRPRFRPRADRPQGSTLARDHQTCRGIDGCRSLEKNRCPNQGCAHERDEG